MVDPYNLPKRMSRPQLEWWILFGIAVAGKGAKQTEAKLRAFLDDLPVPAGLSPFGRVSWLIDSGRLAGHMRKHRLGKYALLDRAYRAAVDLDLDNVTVKSLEAVPGIGQKTARMTMLYYDPSAEVVPLDTHVLKWLRARGYDAPRATPGSRRKYAELERAFVAEARRRKMSVRELDTEVWQSYARAGGVTSSYPVGQ